MGVPLQTAIGTDLLYASISKCGGALVHHQKRNIRWKVVAWVTAGSLPASLLTVWVLKHEFGDANHYKHVLTTALGFMLMVTGCSLLLRKRLQKLHDANPLQSPFRRVVDKHTFLFTALMGVALGVLVTLSSVGAGAFGVVVLLSLFPRLTTIQIIGTDVTHAVLLTLIAGLGHLSMGNVDGHMLLMLLIGGLPAIWVGTHLSSRMPDHIIRPILGLTLVLLSVKFVFY